VYRAAHYVNKLTVKFLSSFVVNKKIFHKNRLDLNGGILSDIGLHLV